jgi:hypothetical protein
MNTARIVAKPHMGIALNVNALVTVKRMKRMYKHCVYDEPLKPYYCEADWNCVDCPNYVEEEENKDEM